MHILAIILSVVFFILAAVSPASNSDLNVTRFEMCKKDPKCSYSPQDIPSSIVKEYFDNK